MKKSILGLLLFVVCVAYSQKKSNGTIYIEHPAITAVEAMTQAFVSGDTAKVASYLADGFKSFNGTSTNKDSKGSDKSNFLNGANWMKENVDYFTITRSPGAYPDALEYKDANNKDVVWVQTWENLNGVNKKTGVKLDMPIHRLFIVDKNNKIKTIINYNNSSVWDELTDSYDTRENGTIYNHHEFINRMRIMIHAFEHKDFDKAYEFYDKNAKFYDINMPVGQSMTLDELKANDKKMLEKFDFTSIDVVGYPDYLHYELGNAKVVQSWWNARMIRKSDKKAIVLPIMFIDTFNDDGMITSEIAYYSEKILE